MFSRGRIRHSPEEPVPPKRGCATVPIAGMNSGGPRHGTRTLNDPRGRAPMRRIAMLSCAIVLLWSCTAFAVTDTAGLTVAVQTTAGASPGPPVATAYDWFQQVGTSPAGLQPDPTSRFTLWFPKEVETNAQYFPPCAASQLDGQPVVPLECQSAIVGSGGATAYAGSPGAPLTSSVREPMGLTVLNGTPAGEQVLIYLRSEPNAPVYVRRVLVGTILGATDPFGFALRVDVPADLQSQLGLAIALTQLSVHIPSTLQPVDVGGSVRSLSYLQMGVCNGSIRARERTEFGGSGQVVEPSANAPCRVALGYPRYPRYPPYPPYPCA